MKSSRGQRCRVVPGRKPFRAFLLNGGLLSGVVLACLSGGCRGPSCESACEKSFSECQLSFFLEEGDTYESQEVLCSSACRKDLKDADREALAVGWIACVEDFSCDPEDGGIPLCSTCQAGYYIGETDTMACQVAN